MNPPQQSRVDKTMKLYRNKTIVRIVNTKMATKNAVRETNNQCLKVNFRKQYLKVKIHERKCSYHEDNLYTKNRNQGMLTSEKHLLQS